MSRRDYLPVATFRHEPKVIGTEIGRPAVKLYLDSEEASDNMQVSSVVSQFENYGWMRALSSGRSYLVIGGEDILDDTIQTGIDSLIDIVSPRFVELRVNGEKEPMRLLGRQVDSYTVEIEDPEEAPDSFDYYKQQSINFGSANFVFDYEYQKKTRRAVNDFQTENGVYDHATYIRVPGDLDNYYTSYEQAKKVCSQNGWYLCPPVLEEPEEEE